MSLNQWISVAVAQKLGVTETEAEFLGRKAGNSRPGNLLAFLDKVRDAPPLPGDER